MFGKTIAAQLLEGGKKIALEWIKKADANKNGKLDAQEVTAAFEKLGTAFSLAMEAFYILQPLIQTYADQYLPKHIDAAVAKIAEIPNSASDSEPVA